LLLILYKGALSLLLFLLFFISVRYMVLAAVKIRTARARLTAGRQRTAPPGKRWFPALSRHVNDLLSATRFMRSFGVFAMLTLILLLTGMIAGVVVFQSLQGVLIMGAVLGCLPYLSLRTRLITRQLRTRLEFLPAVEVFYQQMALTPHPNMRLVLHEVLTGNRILYPIKPTFEQLHRSLSAGSDTADALHIFTLELGHVWADYFANMLRMAIQEGVDITANLKELIEDMRRAQLYDQKARNRLLEIRLASFSPVLFLILFLAINLKLDYENSVHAYFVEAEGRNMLLHALLLQFGSFLMGVYLSMRRM
jgi:Flp pilus assembly protein TadB